MLSPAETKGRGEGRRVGGGEGGAGVTNGVATPFPTSGVHVPHRNVCASRVRLSLYGSGILCLGGFVFFNLKKKIKKINAFLYLVFVSFFVCF